MNLEAIYTPGTSTDHMSFLLTQTGGESVLFSGDIILGTPSTVVEDLSAYMKTLRMLRDKFTFEWVCTTHSVSLDEDFEDTIMMDGPSKLAANIKYREDRLN